MINIVVGVGLLVVSACALVARYLPIASHLALYLVVASPYLMAAAPIALLVLLWGHRWIFAAIAVAMSVAIVVLQVQWYVATDSSPDGVRIRVMTINMRYGRADPQSLIGIAESRADVVLVQEFPPEAAKGLAAAGIEKAFPYHAFDLRPGATGAGLYSRYPITSIDKIGGYALAMVSARLHVDGLTRDPTVVSVHMAAPWPQTIDGWRADLAKLPTTLADLAAKADGGAVLVGGDFNSTIDMLPFRTLLINGWDDSARQSGSGRLRTYPADEHIPPFMGIDHVLTHASTAVSTSSAQVKDTDHRALLTTIVVPKG